MIRKLFFVLVILGGLMVGSPYPSPERALAQTGDPVFVGAGDIANCNNDKDEATAKLLDGIPGTVFTLGDNAYGDGTPAQFADCYGPTWGRHKDRTRPSVGDHDYSTEGAAGYYTYFGAAAGDPAQGYYSYNLGTWHIIALNSEVDHKAGSAQEKWLRADLAASQSMCTLAYWHKPRFSSGKNIAHVQPFWQALYEYGADVVLNANHRTYERFGLQNPNGQADPNRGIREFVVGTGGAALSSFSTIQPNSEARNDTAHGVLKLTLHAGSYDWQFVPIAGQTFTDSGSANCVGSATVPAATLASTPTAVPPTVVPAATETPIAVVPTFVSTNTPSEPVLATATSASISENAESSAVLVSTDQIFADSFDSGNLSAWTTNSTDGGDLSVSTAAALSGSQGLQAVIDDATVISITDDSPNAEPRYRVRFHFDPNSIPMASGDTHVILKSFMGTSNDVMRVEFRRSSGLYQLRAGLLNDGGTWIHSSWFTISDAPHLIEFDWRAATGAGANNGGLTLWIDGAQQTDLARVDNDTRRVDRVRLGALSGIDTGTRGTYFFDAFESRRQSYIGPASGVSNPQGSTPFPAATQTSPAVPPTATLISSPTAQPPTVIPTATAILPPTATLIAPTAPATSGSLGPVKAFPGAEGFGSQTVGGRGGQVIEVTNLNDSGTGSFRACATASGPRTCVFRIGGTITVNSRIEITNPYLTIAGQTAPGGGITIRAAQSFADESVRISTHDVIVRYMRFRAGAAASPNSGRRSLTLNNGAYNVILDHSSFSWATDQPLLLIDGVHDITVQWSIISEALANSTHYENGYQEHSTGLSVSGKNYKSTAQTGNISIHHNLLAHNGGRNPQNAGYGLEDVVNNVIYNWGGQAFTTHDLQANVPSNVVNNFFKAGPNSAGYEVKGSHVNDANTGPRIFVSGNLGPHRTDTSQPDANVVAPDSRSFMVGVHFPAPAVTTTSALQAYTDVLARAGVRFPMLDAVDKRIIEEVKRGEGRIIDCVSAAELTSPINCAARIVLSAANYTRYGISDPLDAKGWPVLALGTAPVDSDHDGMPDVWETARGLNPNANDGAQDRNGDGYTNLEEYLHSLVAP